MEDKLVQGSMLRSSIAISFGVVFFHYFPAILAALSFAANDRIDKIAAFEGGGSVLEDDGNGYFQISMGKGEITDTLTAHFYDWDKQPIGTIVFEKQ